MGLVLQDVFLFSGTVESNLRLGDPSLAHAGDRRTPRAKCTRTSSSSVCRGGYRAIVQERGATLSTGQRQLLAFARALAHDPAC